MIRPLLLYVGLAVALAARAESLGQTGRVTATLKGTVVGDGAGMPVPGAVVRLKGRTAHQTTTGTDGSFTFSDIPLGRYEVTTSKAGWLDGAHGQLRPQGSSVPLQISAHDNSHITLRLWAPAVVSGHVWYGRSIPMPDVEVTAYRRIFNRGIAKLKKEGMAVSDDRGLFRLHSLTPGRYLFAARTTSAQKTRRAGGRL